ncbi:MAG: hypothetical protein H6Q43_2121, partial [Deltaproteobacteria bacterium]|nr:hypothetical protein [Deltaproteobacteria bacterium]
MAMGEDKTFEKYQPAASTLPWDHYR